MRPVDQTIFGAPNGNCFAACVASILELPLEDVPNFCARDGWFLALRDWLKPHGLFPMAFDDVNDETFEYIGDALSIVSGPAARGHLHACVYRGAELLHDPHPSRAGLISFKDMVLFACLDPRARPRL